MGDTEESSGTEETSEEGEETHSDEELEAVRKAEERKSVNALREEIMPEVEDRMKAFSATMDLKLDTFTKQLKTVLSGSTGEYLEIGVDDEPAGGAEVTVKEEKIETPIVGKHFMASAKIPLTPHTLEYFDWFKSITKNDKITIGEFINAVIERYFKDYYGVKVVMHKVGGMEIAT